MKYLVDEMEDYYAIHIWDEWLQDNVEHVVLLEHLGETDLEKIMGEE